MLQHTHSGIAAQHTINVQLLSHKADCQRASAYMRQARWLAAGDAVFQPHHAPFTNTHTLAAGTMTFPNSDHNFRVCVCRKTLDSTHSSRWLASPPARPPARSPSAPTTNHSAYFHFRTPAAGCQT
jgi:hypothetical protein